MILLKLFGVAFVSILGVIPNRTTRIDIKETPIKLTTPKKQKIVATEDILDNDNNYLFVAKNYEEDGEGVFYASGGTTILDSFQFTHTGTYEYMVAELQLLRNYQYAPSRFTIQSTTLEGYSSHFLRACTFVSYDSETPTYYTIYVCNTDTIEFYRANCSFIATNISVRSDTEDFLWLLNQLFDIYTFSESTFIFNSNFNYNAPYGFMTSSTFVNQSATTYNIDLPWFYCNGLAFNRISLVYVDGISTRYIDQNGDLQINTTSNTSYYSLMQYVNTATNHSVMVNSRNFSTYTDSDGYIQTYLNNGSQWINDSYRTITFSDILTPTQIDGLTVFNTNLNTGYIDNTTGVVTDIGLGSIFALIGSAFGAVSGFLAIQIMPGLTLGLLLFTPLIVGIILAIVWLVKR